MEKKAILLILILLTLFQGVFSQETNNIIINIEEKYYTGQEESDSIKNYDGISFDILGTNLYYNPLNLSLSIYPPILKDYIKSPSTMILNKERKILWSSEIIPLDRLNSTSLFINVLVNGYELYNESTKVTGSNSKSLSLKKYKIEKMDIFDSIKENLFFYTVLFLFLLIIYHYLINT